MDDRLEQFVRTTFRTAGRRYAEARRAYRTGEASVDVPRDGDGNVRIVCRREAERRALALDDAGRPECFEAGHPDCEGCLEDVREGVVETW